IQLENLSERFDIDFGAVKKIEIQVRGPQKTLDGLTSIKLVKADLERYEETGAYEIPLSVELPEDCALVSEASVLATIIEKQ
ncbi:MAG: CdaR family protein, partial [Dorea sp.]|nr:CdaR family protein [Dorea sp.]